MRTHIAVSALAVGLALTGCGQQSLVGEGAMDPETPQLTAEEAQEEAARLQEEGVGHGGEAAGGSGTGENGHGSDSGSGSGSPGATAGTGGSESGGPAGGSGTSEPEAHAGSDEGSGTVTSTEPGATGSGTDQLTDQALAQFEQQFPAISRVVSEQQLRTTATQVCSAIRTGGTAAGQQVVENLPGVSATAAQQVVGFLDREVCTR